jgi:hypothetical protein
MNARLGSSRLGLIERQVQCQSRVTMTMRLQMSEGCPKTTLGDLQGDQSKETTS